MARSGRPVETAGIMGRGPFGYTVTPGGTGGCWNLETHSHRRLDYLVGREVRVEGTHLDFNTLIVRRIAPVVPFETDPDPRSFFARLFGRRP